jgi:hypothetical protein
MGLQYVGSSFGSTGNPPMNTEFAVGGKLSTERAGNGMTGAKAWMFTSTCDIVDFVSLNSFNDGVALGMTGGDIIFMVSGTAGSTTPKFQAGVLVTSAAATGFAISSNIISSTAV